MKTWSCALMGFGAVGRAFAQLVLEKQERIRRAYGVELVCTGIWTARHGSCLSDEASIDLRKAIEAYHAGDLGVLSQKDSSLSAEEWLEYVSADVFIELSPLNPHTGEPALSYIKKAFMKKMHVVTANKGPIALAYPELIQLSKTYGRLLRFEATVMDGAPLFHMARTGLPVVTFDKVEGVLTSTANLVLTRMEQSMTLEQAIREAQDMGIAESDPSFDIDGWDTAVKLCVIATALFHSPIHPEKVDRDGIRSITPEKLKEVSKRGKRIKLLGRLEWENGELKASVRPTELDSQHPLALLHETSTGVILYARGLTPFVFMEMGRATPDQTAYGVLSDTLDIIRQTRGEHKSEFFNG